MGSASVDEVQRVWGKCFCQFLKVKLPCYSANPLQGDIEEELKQTHIKAVHVV